MNETGSAETGTVLTTPSPSSPSKKCIKGALIGIDVFNPVASAIVFQYAPETVTRTLQTQTSGDGGARSEALRLGGAPVETIKMEIEIDGTDLWELGDKTTLALGVHPQLAALEMLTYPKATQVTMHTKSMGMGTIEIVPPGSAYDGAGMGSEATGACGVLVPYL